MENFKLSKEIINLSVSQVWDKAKLEWVLSDIYFSDDFENCLCGHEIIECCVLTNTINKNECVVGNVCVNRFMGIDSDKIFDAVKRVKKDLSKSLNVDALQYAHQKCWINDWEKDFYNDTLRKRKMSEKQEIKRKQINQKIIYNITNSKSDLVSS